MTDELVLRVADLSVSRGGRCVLSDVAFTAYSGELIGILGPNGSGKSTLLEALVAGLPRESGTIEVFGRELGRLKSRQRAQYLAYLGPTGGIPPGINRPQLTALGRIAHRSAIDHASPEDERRIEQAMHDAQVALLANREVAKLSSGERARAGLARVLAQGAPILLLDEPTAHLDLGHRLELLGLARTLAQRGHTLLVVLHDLDLAARYCDRAIVIKDGRSAYMGTVPEVFRSEVLNEVFGVQGALRFAGGRIIGLDVELPGKSE